MNPTIRLLIALLLALGTAMPSVAETKGQELIIGLIPEMNVFKQMERFNPLAEYLTEQTGIRVSFSILSRYGNIIDSFTTGNLDGAFFGSFTGALAIEKLGVEPLARPVNLDGESTYHAHIYTRKDSGIKTVADMRGKRFAFVEKATTAGYIFPMAYLKDHGVTDLEGYFSEYFFAGSHDATLAAVLNNKADIGASKNTVYDWVRQSDPRVDKDIVILAESSKVPSNGLCVRAKLDENLKQSLKLALLNLNKTPRGHAVLEKFKALRFIETTEEDYRPVFDLAARAGIDLATYQYRNQ